MRAPLSAGVLHKSRRRVNRMAERQCFEKAPCKRCDSPGGERTLRNQVCMPLNGRVECIDFCIHQIVAALNAGGVRTVGSCCGHGTMKGNIILESGRVLIIEKKPESLEDWGKAVAL